MNTDQNSPQRWARYLSWFFSLGLLTLLVTLFAGLRLIPIVLWMILTGLMIVLLIALGVGANGVWYGALVDSRNRVSLSRLQITMWTVMAFSAFLGIGLARMVPGALQPASDEAKSQCQAAYLLEKEEILDLATLRENDPVAASQAEARAQAECVLNPLQIRLPDELLIALGISTASFAGSALVQSNKRNKIVVGFLADLKQRSENAENEAADKKRTFDDFSTRLGNARQDYGAALAVLNAGGLTPEEQTEQEKRRDDALNAINYLEAETDKAEDAWMEADTKASELRQQLQREDREQEGLLYVNASPKDARLSDLFQGDEIGNYMLIDLGKVQMFFITIVVLAAYTVALRGLFLDHAALFNPLGVDFPQFSSSLNTLLGISHAGYLSVKSVDQTRTAGYDTNRKE
jgi:hypothetical protein